jgi:hypothetical protein
MCPQLSSSVVLDITDSLGVLCCRLGEFDPLPPELCELILSFLDVRTLCTARLVCRPFRQAASYELRSLKLSAEYLRSHPDVNFGNLPNVDRVAVSRVDCEAGDLDMLGHHVICDEITHLKVVNYKETPATFTLPELPNLRSMTVERKLVKGIVSCTHLRSLMLPLTLQELWLEEHFVANADALNCLTRLTSLSLDITWDAQLPCVALTIFSALKKLKLTCIVPHMPSFGKLTQLTHFVWDPQVYGGGNIDSAPLTQLQRLVHLGVRRVWNLPGVEATLEWFKHIGAVTTLKSLDIAGLTAPHDQAFPAAEATKALGPLSCLTSLALSCCCVDLASLPRVTMEGLQALALFRADHLTQNGLLALGRATGLIRLTITCGWVFQTFESFEVGFVAQDLCRIVSGLSRLQALNITTEGLPGISCCNFVGPLTSLTGLSWFGDCIMDADVAACLGLRKLRVLKLGAKEPAPSGCVSREAYLELAKLPELYHFELNGGPGCMLHEDLPQEIDTLLISKMDSRGWPSPSVMSPPSKYIDFLV